MLLCTFWSLKSWNLHGKEQPAHQSKCILLCSTKERKSGTFLEANILFLGWTITFTTCVVDTARLHNCKQVTTASSCNSELQSHVAQSNPSYYGLQNTFHKRIKKTLVGPFAQAETAQGLLEIHLGAWPRLEGWSAIPNTVPIQLPYDLKWLSSV